MNPARIFAQTGGTKYVPNKSARHGELSEGEAKALDTLRREASDRGATLHSGGRGGLPPSLVLGVLRRDEYECKVKRKGCTKDKDLTIHHKGGILASAWLVRKGHKREMSNLVTSCNTCHDTIHEDARSKGTDASQH